MIHTIAIDPGARQNAIAVFVDSRLAWAGFEAAFLPLLATLQRNECVETIIEKPQIDRRSPGKLADLINVTANGYRLVGRIDQQVCLKPERFHERTPQAWKGSVEKPIHHSRALYVLMPGEIQRIPFATPTRENLIDYVHAAVEKNAKRKSRRLVGYTNVVHNLLDAVALGLTYLGRLNKTSVYARTKREFEPRRSLV